jgi:hypothetical protein
MPLKSSGPGEEYAVVNRFDGGVGWIAHPEETMQRASHALVGREGDANSGGADVWVVDPVDADGIDDLFAEFGDVRGVVVLMDRHARDAATVAARHDVPVYVPDCVDVSVDAPTESVSGSLPDTDFSVVETIGWPGWTEAALYDGETLVVGDAVGTADYFTTGSERIGVHPMLRVKPPSALRQFAPDRILCGHGHGVLQDGTTALRNALDGARRRAPRLWGQALKSLLSR